MQSRAGFLHELAHRRVFPLVLRVVVRAQVVVIAAAVGVAADASGGACADARGLGCLLVLLGGYEGVCKEVEELTPCVPCVPVVDER